MRIVRLLMVLLACVAPCAALAQSAPPASLLLSDGATATAYPHCGDADLCATVEYENGDVLEMYSEGAEADQPYILLFVKVHGPTTIYQYSRVVGFLPAVLTMDRGLVHLTVYQNHDGTISLEFSKP